MVNLQSHNCLLCDECWWPLLRSCLTLLRKTTPLAAFLANNSTIVNLQPHDFLKWVTVSDPLSQQELPRTETPKIPLITIVKQRSWISWCPALGFRVVLYKFSEVTTIRLSKSQAATALQVTSEEPLNALNCRVCRLIIPKNLHCCSLIARSDFELITACSPSLLRLWEVSWLIILWTLPSLINRHQETPALLRRSHSPEK